MELVQLPDTGISSVGINIACNSGCTITYWWNIDAYPLIFR